MAPVTARVATPVLRLEYRNVTMRFADNSGRSALTAIRDVSFSVCDGEVVSLIGPSGCGKSTLLNIGSGLTAPSEGSAFVDGERVAGPNAHVAFMLQKDLLLPWRTILRERHVRRRNSGRAARRTPAARGRTAGEFQPRRVFRPLPASAVWRHAPARGAGADARRRSARLAARRAVLGGRCADPDGPAARPGADAQAIGKDRAPHYP